MMAAFASLMPWQKWADVAVAIVLAGALLWVGITLHNRAQEIELLTAEKASAETAARDNATAAQTARTQLAQTTAALKVANQHAQINADEAGKLRERISHAPKNGCTGPAERALLDGLRTDALNRRSQVPQPVAP